MEIFLTKPFNKQKNNSFVEIIKEVSMQKQSFYDVF
jgi:hypothetical protein